MKYIKQIFKKMLQKIRQIFYIVMYKINCIFFKLNDNKVLFLSSSRENLTGNFEFVYNEIKNRNKYEINYILKKNIKTRYSLKQKFLLPYLIATSKYIFLDDFYPMIYAINLRKNTQLIQLWHAMGAYKRVGYSRMNKKGGPSVKSLTHKNYTGTIVSSPNIRKNYAEAFGISINKVHALGIPRTDIFFDEKYKIEIKKKLEEKYPQIVGKKVLLFAPTFRGNGQKSAMYNFDWIDFKKMSDIYSKDYVCLYKLHPFIKNRPEYDLTKDGFYIDVTDQREINDLLFVTDILITDYSSVIFEYSFFNKPVIFYMPDLDDYKNSRDFYYPISKYLYGDIVKKFDDLITKIQIAKVDEEKLIKFKKFFCSSCDGKSTERVVDYFLENNHRK